MNEKRRGSEWRKWDLHIHSCYSILNNGYPHNNKGKIDDETINKFIETIKENNISVVGLTNYFKFTEYDFNLKNKLKSAGITTFLNLEVRLNNINKSDELFDYHIIFDDKLDDQIIKDLLVNFKANTGNEEKSFSRLSKQEIESTASVTFQNLISTLEEKGNQVQNRYLCGFLSRGHGSATSDSIPKNKAVFENIVKRSDFLIHASTNMNNLKKDREMWLHKLPYIRPLVQSSDSHDLTNIGKKYSWIKADTTFEGLKQILFEPEDRICLEVDKPETKSDYQVIDRIMLSDEKSIYLNSNLNTVIGGRATGKSTFTNSIANKLQNKAFVPEKMHTYDEDGKDRFKIFWQDEKIDNNREIEFLPQNYMIQLAENQEERKKLVESIIRSKENGIHYKKISDYDSKVLKNQSDILEKLNEYYNTKHKLQELIKPEGDKEGIEFQIEKLTEEQSQKRKEQNFSDEDSNSYDILTSQIFTQEEDKKTSTKNLEFLNDLTMSNFSLNKDISNLDSSLKEDIYKKLLEIESKAKQEWENIVSEFCLKEKQNIERLEKKIQRSKQSDAFLKGINNISQSESLTKIATSIDKESIKLNSLKQYEKDRKSLNNELDNKRKEILKSYSNYSKFRNELEESFSIKTEKVEIKITFQSKEFSGDILDGRSIEKVNFLKNFNKNPDKEIQHIFENKHLKYNTKSGSERYCQDDLENILLSDVWYGFNFLLQYDGDDFSKMSQGKKSFVILNLILEFSDDKKPVILDQPEDSLDNRAIYNDLTEYIKRKKKQRQIIIVTHNPNVVVGADAENIIVANQHSGSTPNENGEQFDYTNGALECITAEDPTSSYILPKQSIRDHMFEILEGGRSAFEKREKKYNLGKID